MLGALVLSAMMALGACQEWDTFSYEIKDISARGEELWMLDVSSNVYRWNKGEWEKKPGTGYQISASPDGNSWMVQEDQTILRFSVEKQVFEKMPGYLIQVSCASRDLAIGVNSNQGPSIWRNNAWTNLPGHGIWASVGSDGDVWLVNRDQTIFRWMNNNWVLTTGNAHQIDVQDTKHIVATNKQGDIFAWTGATFKPLKGKSHRCSINKNALFCIGHRAFSALWSVDKGSHEHRGDSIFEGLKRVKTSEVAEDSTSIIIELTN